MIPQDNLRQLLDHLGFTQSGQRHSKTLGDAMAIERRAIAAAEALIAAAPARRQAILERYL